MANPQTFSGRPLISLVLNHSVSGATVNWNIAIYETSSQPSFSGFPADNLLSYNFSAGGGPSASNVQFVYDFSPTGLQTIVLASGSFTATASPFTATASVASASVIGNASVDQVISPSLAPPAPVFTHSTITSTANINASYSSGVAASNSPTYSVRNSANTGAGTLPAGLTLNTSTGAITGKPTAAGAVSFRIRATNAGGTADTGILTITVFSHGRVWDGNSWEPAIMKVWDGNSWEPAIVNIWDGNSWEPAK